MTVSESLSKNPLLQMRIPGSSPVDLSQHTLIYENHQKHDVFFDVVGQNHFLYHYLAAYSLGASKERLQAIYDAHTTYLRPKPASMGTLTRETYRQELGNRKAYTSYLDLFQDEIERYGMFETIHYWMFKDDMLAHFLGGMFHGLIHLGYAIEFNLPVVAAEALAMAACSDAALAPLIVLTEEKDTFTSADPGDINTSTTDNGTKSVEEIIKEIQKDSALDGVVQFKDPLKSRAVLQNQTAASKLREYAAQWHYKGPKSSLQELFTNYMLLYATTGIREKAIKLDFFLMHCLTSIHAIHSILPHLTATRAELLLRGHLVGCLMYYISRGRPTMQVDLLLQYKHQQEKATTTAENPWLDLFNRALAAEETHVIKVVRALALGQMCYGSPVQEELLLKAAQMTVDIAGRSPDPLVSWDLAGIGFEEAWQQ